MPISDDFKIEKEHYDKSLEEIGIENGDTIEIRKSEKADGLGHG